jgi:hypothetical protein
MPRNELLVRKFRKLSYQFPSIAETQGHGSIKKGAGAVMPRPLFSHNECGSLPDLLEDPVFDVPVFEVVVVEEIIVINQAEGAGEGEAAVFESEVAVFEVPVFEIGVEEAILVRQAAVEVEAAV